MFKKKKHEKDDILNVINNRKGPAISALQKEPGIKDEHEFERRIEKLRIKGKLFNKIYSATGALAIILFAVVCAVVIYFFYYNESEVNSLDFVTIFKEKYQCRMDMRVCLDGSIINRIPPECDFPECPRVADKKINLSKVQDSLDFNCVLNRDCSKHVSSNTCQLFCANQNINNEKVISGFKKTCDSALWDPPLNLSCGCVNNKCSFID